MKFIINLFILLNSICLLAQTNFYTNFKTFELSAEIKNQGTPVSTVNSFMDDNGNVHIAWIKFADGTETGRRFVMYTFFNKEEEQFYTKTVDDQDGIYARGMPFIITDSSNNPHITYFLRRSNGGTRSGNYAIMYATSSGVNEAFTLSKVSTNSTDSTNNDKNIFNCYVNGRPRIFFENGIPVVTYVSESNNLNSYNNYMIYAKKQGNDWSRTQEFNTDDSNFMGGTYSERKGISLDNNSGDYVGYNDISDYYPRYLYKHGGNWMMNRINEYNGTYEVDSPKIIKDNSGTVHFFWYYEGGSSGEERFCHTTLNGGTYSSINEIFTTGSNTNHHLATVDVTSGKQAYFYEQRVGWTFNGKGTVVLEIGSEFFNFEVTNIGRIYGKNNLHAKNGKISIVTASKSHSKIYVTINTEEELSTNIYTKEKNIVYPTPVKDKLYFDFPNAKIQEIEIYDVKGIKVERFSKDNFAYNSLQLNKLKSGIYFIRIKTNKGITTRKVIKN